MRYFEFKSITNEPIVVITLLWRDNNYCVYPPDFGCVNALFDLI